MREHHVRLENEEQPASHSNILTLRGFVYTHGCLCGFLFFFFLPCCPPSPGKFEMPSLWNVIWKRALSFQRRAGAWPKATSFFLTYLLFLKQPTTLCFKKNPKRLFDRQGVIWYGMLQGCATEDPYIWIFLWIQLVNHNTGQDIDHH